MSSGQEVGRREVLSFGLAAGVLGVIGLVKGYNLLSDREAQDNNNADAGVAEFELKAGPQLFENEDAQAVAEALAIDTYGLWHVTPEAMERVSASSEKDGYLTQSELLPIYPAAIYEHASVIEEAAQRSGVPANVLATIASIESAGLTNALSGADAHGLFQVVPRYHQDRIVRIAAEQGVTVTTREDTVNALDTPLIGALVGADIIKEYHQAVVNNTELSPNSPISWARTLASYNGGPSLSGADYYSMPSESQRYIAHGIRYFMTAEIAAQLRNRGLNNQEIAEAMVSTDTDARAYAYVNAKAGRLGQGIEGYEHMWRALADPEFTDPKSDDPALAQELSVLYQSYLSGAGNYALPLAPGLRIWLAHGGVGLFERLPQNMDPQNYAHPSLN